jgi:hypothetical protein
MNKETYPSTNIIQQPNKKANIETRFANRMQSIFSAAGQIVNDFYLEIGIYCIGLLNASLVAWSIYTDLMVDNQPLLYAIALGIIALIAVEGLAVYLVGAAAKTNNSWLWFFSVIFAGFFTFAHSYGSANISHYITWAVPFFIVVGYWARTIKSEIEDNAKRQQAIEDEERIRQQQIEDEERRAELERKARQQAIEDEERRIELEIKRLNAEQKHTERMAKITQQSVQSTVQGTVQSTVQPLTPTDVKNAVSEAEKPINITKLAKNLGVSRGTLYTRLNSLVSNGEMIKNGNGYEVVE